MTTGAQVGSDPVPSFEIDIKTRQRIAANLRLLKHQFKFETDAAMAEKLELSRGVVNRALKGERTVGLEVLLKVHRNLHVSLDWLVDKDPPSAWFDPDYSPPF